MSRPADVGISRHAAEPRLTLILAADSHEFSAVCTEKRM